MISTRAHRILWAQKSSARDVDQNFCLLTLIPSSRIASYKFQVQLAEHDLRIRTKGLHIDLQLFGAIDSAKYQRRDRENLLEVLVYKKEMSGKDWPRLLKPNPESSFDYCDSATITPYRFIDEDEQEDLRNRLRKMRTVHSDNIDERSATGKVKLLSYWKRPVDFDNWLARANRAVELRNFKESALLRLPRELRDEIWKLALVDVETVRMFNGLLPYAEDQFARRLPRLGDQFLLPSLELNRERSKVFTRNKKGDTVVNFFTKPPRYNRGVGLFTTSRTISRESLQVLYSNTRFIFPDQYGIVGVKCFLNTIGKHNMSNLRRITIHMPPWHFPKFSDQQRAGWIYQSARAHGLEVAKKPRDPLLRSFDTALTAIINIERLRELDIQVSPFVTTSFVLNMRVAGPDDSPELMNRRTCPKYLARSEAELAILRKLKDITPRVHVRFLALEYTTEDTDFMKEHDKEKYWDIVENRCTQWGFDYVKVKSREDEPSEQGKEGEVDK